MYTIYTLPALNPISTYLTSSFTSSLYKSSPNSWRPKWYPLTQTRTQIKMFDLVDDFWVCWCKGVFLCVGMYYVCYGIRVPKIHSLGTVYVCVCACWVICCVMFGAWVNKIIWIKRENIYLAENVNKNLKDFSTNAEPECVCKCDGCVA